ncbi:MAG: hypothetical protein IJP31_04800 [Lachnospiraceae bacterium]|nr:hypothetical protein [Lachnospiraceae bacterium]
MSIQKKKTAVYILLSLVVIVLAYWPHFQKGIWDGFDEVFHFYRIQGLADMLKEGVFPVKLHFTQCYGYGYGVGYFYANTFLYIPALLINLCGFSLLGAYKLFMFLVYCAIFGAGFYSAWRLTGKSEPEGAFFAATFLLFSARLLQSVFQAMSLGQTLCFIFIPLAVAGMYLFLARDESPMMLVAGFTGVIFSHTISAFLCFCTCLFFCIWYVKKLIFNPKKLFTLIWAVGIVTGITSVFWVPMLEQLKTQWLKVRAPWTTSEQNVEKFSGVFATYSLRYMLVLLFVICLLLLLINAVKSKKILKPHKDYGIPFFVLSIFMTWLTTAYPFWHFMNSTLGIKIIQTPHRLFTPVTILIISGMAVLYPLVNCKKVFKRIILVLVWGVGIFSYYQDYSDHFLKTDYNEINEVIAGTVAGLGAGEEWLPIETDREEMTEPLIATDNEGNKVLGEKTNNNTVYRFTADLSKEYYDIPYIWYRGFKASDEQGNVYEIGQSRKTGMVIVHMPEGGEGSTLITITHGKTKWEKLSYLSTLGGVVMLGGYLWFEKRGKGYVS